MLGVDIEEALKELFGLRDNLEWDFEFDNKKRAKYIQAIDVIIDEWKDFAEEARQAAALERTIERVLKENGYITKKEVENMFIEHDGEYYE